MNVKLGKEVGFSVPFQNCYNNDDTRIKYLTENMLLRELYYNPLVCSTSVQFSFQLSQYSVIIIDDAHERTVNTDLLLGILKVLRKHRPELRIIVMSASVCLQHSKERSNRLNPNYSRISLIRQPPNMMRNQQKMDPKSQQFLEFKDDNTKQMSCMILLEMVY